MSNSPRTIRHDIRGFISAFARELGSVRELVKKGFEDNDYHAVEQDIFPPDFRDLKAKVLERINSSWYSVSAHRSSDKLSVTAGLRSGRALRRLTSSRRPPRSARRPAGSSLH
jgi:hypothetical protein